ncbi:hypothetical protein F5X68DRAFT_217993 [Plectosphaerella plurivora]|uniref:Uncharacterized protein n=1 Tax=Plectosphaerella plurivora TaxID=936078 RepID=A0A9P8V1P3_9PEZI|nr:hypothetical protein F5X68DRAFT_217993 [Plectosphaerella plurivora]
MNGQQQSATYSESRVWLITGCSSGFGRELVLAASACGDRVIATARRIADLEYCQSLSNVRRLELDVTTSQADLDAKVHEAVKEFGRLDVLVNNAGYVLSGVWEELSQEQIQAQFDTLVFGPLKLTRSVLPHMRSQKSGSVLFMGSISGWHGVAGGGPYSAAKFALEGAVECLSKETQQLGISVHILVLGQFRTSILELTKKKAELDPARGEVCYASIKAEMARIHAATTGAQPGDPVRASERIVELAHRALNGGVAAAGMPIRIPIGSDAVQVMRSKCERTLASLNEWEAFASSSDFPEKAAVPTYLR